MPKPLTASSDTDNLAMPCHSIEAFSRLSEVAATMGLMTPRHLTFRQAVLPLAMARSSAPGKSSRRVTNSPYPPRPSNIAWKGMSRKSVAKCRPFAKRRSCCWLIQSSPPLLSTTTTIGISSWKHASIYRPPDKKAPSPVTSTQVRSRCNALAVRANETPTPSRL